MKHKLVLLFLALSVFMVGCSSAPKQEEQKSAASDQTTAADAHYPVTVTTHNYGKEPVEITFTKAPEKVFAVYQNSIETLLALGLEDHMVAAAGLDQDVKAEYAEAFKKVNYLTEFTPDQESVLMMSPDMILSWYSYFGEKNLGDVGFYHERGIQTYMMQNSGAVKPAVLENEYTDILNIGKIFNVEAKAEAIVNEMKTQVKNIADQANKMSEKPKVLVMEMEKDGVRVYGENTLGGDMVTQLGAQLVTAPENKMSSEALIASNPDVIFTVYFGSSDSVADGDSAIATLMNDPKYQSLNAVKNKRVYAISLGEMYCSGTRTLDGILRLAKGIYPEMEMQ